MIRTITPRARHLSRAVATAGALSLTVALTSCASTSRSATSAAERGDWVRDATSLTRKVGDSTLWRFSYDEKAGKPYFHPVAVANGPSLTNFKPEDHPWHYALWFSWKYVNKINYW